MSNCGEDYRDILKMLKGEQEPEQSCRTKTRSLEESLDKLNLNMSQQSSDEEKSDNSSMPGSSYSQRLDDLLESLQEDRKRRTEESGTSEHLETTQLFSTNLLGLDDSKNIFNPITKGSSGMSHSSRGKSKTSKSLDKKDGDFNPPGKRYGIFPPPPKRSGDFKPPDNRYGAIGSRPDNGPGYMLTPFPPQGNRCQSFQMPSNRHGSFRPSTKVFEASKKLLVYSPPDRELSSDDEDNQHRVLLTYLVVQKFVEDTMEVFISLILYLFPGAISERELKLVCKGIKWSVRVVPFKVNNKKKPSNKETHCFSETELLGYLTGFWIFMGKTAGVHGVKQSFVNYCQWLISSKLSITLDDDWIVREQASAIANETDRNKLLRTLLFNALLDANDTAQETPQIQCTAIALDSLKGAFLTSIRKVVEEIIEPGYDKYATEDSLTELHQVLEYIKRANQLTRNNWLYVKFEVSESCLKPLAASRFPILTSAALSLAARKCAAAEHIACPALSSSQQRQRNKLLAAVAADRKLRLGAAAGDLRQQQRWQREISAILRTPYAKFDAPC